MGEKWQELLTIESDLQSVQISSNVIITSSY